MQAVIGLAGVVVGAVLSALLGYTQERRREHTQIRSGVRLLVADLEDAQAELERIHSGPRVAGGRALAQLKELWLDRRDPLARGLERTEWANLVYHLRLIQAPSGRARAELYEAQLKTIDVALGTARNVLERLERRWRNRLRSRLTRLRLRSGQERSGLAPETLGDLVWARFAWEQEDDPDAGRRYQLALAGFEAAHGRIVEAYWTTRFAGGVALTEHPNRGIRRLLRGRRTLAYHRVTDFATREAPALAEVLYRYDVLAVRISWVLRGTPLEIAMRWVLAGSAKALAFSERGEYSAEELDRFIDGQVDEQDEIEAYYRRTGAGRARRTYLLGGAVAVLSIAGVAGALSIAFAYSPATPISAVVAGAVGALVSVTARIMSRRGKVYFELGPVRVFEGGVIRAGLGAALGAAVYLVAQSLIANPNPFALSSIAFLAGFTERWIRVIRA